MFHVISRQSGKALNIADSSLTSGAEAEQRTAGVGSDSDNWRIQYVAGTGYVRLIAEHSQHALAVKGNSKDNGASIVQLSQSTSGFSLDWCLMDISEGYYKIMNRRSELLVSVDGGFLDDGTDIVQWPDVGNPNEEWKLEPV